MEPIGDLTDFEGLISFGFPHLIPADCLARFPRGAVNLHISLLPWNRGAHPNFWAFYDNLPHGVTLHVLEAGLDTGPILVQRPVTFEPQAATFQETWQHLVLEAEMLFLEAFDAWWEGRLSPKAQGGAGSYHRKDQLPDWEGGWNAPVARTIHQLRQQAAQDAASLLSRLTPSGPGGLDPLLDRGVLKRLMLAQPRWLRAVVRLLEQEPKWMPRPDTPFLADMLRGHVPERVSKFP